MTDGSVLQSAQRCFEKKSRVVVKMVVIQFYFALTYIQTKLYYVTINLHIMVHTK